MIIFVLRNYVKYKTIQFSKFNTNPKRIGSFVIEKFLQNLTIFFFKTVTYIFSIKTYVFT